MIFLGSFLSSLFMLMSHKFSVTASVTRSGDFLDFGQLFRAFGKNLFAQISQHS